MKLSNALINEMAANIVVSKRKREIRHIAAGGLVKTEPTEYVEYYAQMRFSSFEIASELMKWEQSKNIIIELELIRDNVKMIFYNCYPEIQMHLGSDGQLDGHLILNMSNYNLRNHNSSWKDWFILGENKNYATK